MEIHHLRSFVAIAVHGRLAAAARVLHRSQSAVSGHIAELETELGARLFVRSRTGMRLTTAGDGLLPRAQAALAAVDGILDTSTAGTGLHGELDVGTIADAVWLRSPQAISLLRRRHPGLAVRLHQGISGRVQRDIVEGRLHAGWAIGPVDDPRLVSRVLVPVRLRVAGPAAWADRLAAAARADLAAFPWVATPLECPFTGFVATLLASVEPIRPVQADMEASLCGIAVAGLALTLLREDVALTGVARGELAIWPGELPATELRFITSTAQAGDPRLLALADAVAEVWRLGDAARYPAGARIGSSER